MTNPLTDIIPAAARKYVYAVVTLAALALAAWQASDGNLETFIGSLVTALVTALAASNTSAPSAPSTPSADESGAVDVGLGLLIVVVIAVTLLLFGVRFDR